MAIEKAPSTEKQDSPSASKDVVHLETAGQEDEAARADELARGGKSERKVKLKIDLFILPLLASIYFLAQMGRSDLGNAQVAGLDEDLNLTPDMYANVAAIFYVGYLIFQLPGTLLLRKIGPANQFAGAMIGWGVVTVCTVKASTYGHMMAIRFLVGVTEAFIQGSILYLSFWYRYNELATRGAIVYSTSALAGSFNGILSYGVQRDLGGKNGWTAWQWIFFVEGLIPIIWAFAVWALLPPTPEKVRFGFSEAEKKQIVTRSRASHNTGNGTIRPKLIIKLLLDPKFWMTTAINCGNHFCANALQNFIPALLHGSMGYTELQAQLMSVIVYAVTFVGILVSCYASDRLRLRGVVIMFDSALACVGLVLLLTITHNAGRFVAACITMAGVYPIVVICLTWTATNHPGYTYRASAAALINVFSQAVAIAGNKSYNDPPYYRTGLGASLGMVAMCGVVAGFLDWHLKRLNAKKRREQHTPEAEALRQLSIDEVGNKHPDFFFKY
ncbi:hypothetical protein DL768_007149 [Monosporascus sp. mg162]|nr:hypothetical protein DL768_007149 [Monosporascus sp. mg162]